uniref:Uncharacterized protein n=1 Tax=Anguilla anguilla TaxID=7936 RepID=A0A0E9PRL9_ANGAN
MVLSMLGLSEGAREQMNG